jgi:predicted nuclease of predicted toxin-antitoxin system
MYFLFDENVPYKFVQGLILIEESNHKSPIRVKITHPKLLDNEGATDEEQIHIAGKHGGIIVSFDKDFKHIKSYYPLYKKNKVGVVCLKLTKEESNYWGIVKLVINHWEDIKLKLKDHEKPFAYQVSKKGIQRFEF